MADETQKQTVTLEELMVSNLAMSDATVKLLIEKDNFSCCEPKQHNAIGMEVCYGSYQTLR